MAPGAFLVSMIVMIEVLLGSNLRAVHYVKNTIMKLLNYVYNYSNFAVKKQ